MAADLAASLCEWLHLIEQFDREGCWADAGLSSCAAWLSWTCSVAPGTAREYVRIARALPLLPLVDAAFAAGRLSYSKVRVLVQVAAEVDEAVLLDQAQIQTVSQLERTVRAFRRSEGWSQQRKRRAVWRWDEDGMLVLSARLPADEGALLVAALERAGDDVAPPGTCSGGDESSCGDGTTEGDGGDGAAGGDGVAGGDCGDGHDGVAGGVGSGVGGGVSPLPARPASGGGPGRDPMPSPSDDAWQRAELTGADPLGVSGADTLVALALRALAAGEVDSSGDDRHLLVLHADLGQLSDAEPAGGADPATPSGAPSDVPAGTATLSGRPTGFRCHIEDGPGVDRHTARRIACDAALVAVLHHVGEGEPLRVGRKTRAISPAQRRALRVRDGGCRFPACHRRRHLEAHHVQPWSLMGPTDLENLVLLCRFHHMLIHEGGFRVSPAAEGAWEFHDPRGVPVPPAPALPGSRGDGPPMGAADPLGLLPGWAGEPFHVAETVAVLARFPRGDG